MKAIACAWRRSCRGGIGVVLGLLGLLGLASPAAAQELIAGCRVQSSYDVRFEADRLLFERAQPSPRQVELQQGRLRSDGRPVPLDAAAMVRLAGFEREARALLPPLRAIALRGVDLAQAELAAAGAKLDLDAAAQVDFRQRLAAAGAEIKARIVASHASRDWHGEAFDAYVERLGGELSVWLAGVLGEEALAAAMSGDLDRAMRLRDQAATLAGGLELRVRRRLEALRPSLAALCPRFTALIELQRGLVDDRGRPLVLLEKAP